MKGIAKPNIALLIFSFTLCFLGLLGLSSASAREAEVLVLRVKGEIVPVVADYIEQGIRRAEREGASAVIIGLETPGGLYKTTQEIVQSFLAADVPVVVYVAHLEEGGRSACGGWAGSAGTFITLAAHVAAMAPGSRIGAAHPVAVGPQGELPESYEKKITEDAAAFIRSIAERRGRDPKLAELAVTESLSWTAEEAYKAGLVDLVASDLQTLLSELEEKVGKVKLDTGREVLLRLRGAEIRWHKMSPIQKFLQVISDPNIAYILLSIGSIGLISEIAHPGAVFPGVAGGISLFLGLYSLHVLDAWWAGILLLILGFALLLADLFVTSHGALTAGGIASLVFGALMLFSRAEGGEAFAMGVSPWAIGIVAGGAGAFFAFVLRAIIRSYRRPETGGYGVLIGKTATVRTPLRPKGTVFVHGELWEAVLEEGSAEAGEEVIVVGADGLKLKVKKKEGGERR